MARKNKLLYTDSEWTFDKIQKVYDEIEKIALDELKLNVYPNQIEIISSEQMLDAYTSVGMPIMYKHWSFGKRFINEEQKYRKGLQGLAYEIVINSDPCISYCMEENTMTMQTLVIAHAAFGHNHFFANNYLFKEWTSANEIIPYLIYARDFIAKCEEKYGEREVEKVLNSCHALQDQGINKYKRRAKLTVEEKEQEQSARQEFIQKNVSKLWDTLSKKSEDDSSHRDWIEKQKKDMLNGSQENLLYFVEKHSPSLESWQREIVRIVRKIAQYFYPQRQTKVMNEGCATFVHYFIMNRLYDKGLIDDGHMMEFMISHSNVTAQHGFNDYGYYVGKDGKRRRYSKYNGINPYALGFDMFMDIKRICENPTDEDKEWFPDIAGENWLEVFLDTVQNYRDETFIHQFLSPKVMRDWRLFDMEDDAEEDDYVIKSIHNEYGYNDLRKALAKQYSPSLYTPDLRVVDVDFKGDRSIYLKHYAYDEIQLEEKQTKETLKHFHRLWGHDVYLDSVDYETNELIEDYNARKKKSF
jgi:stage V sporulation protein R